MYSFIACELVESISILVVYAVFEINMYLIVVCLWAIGIIDNIFSCFSSSNLPLTFQFKTTILRCLLMYFFTIQVFGWIIIRLLYLGNIHLTWRGVGGLWVFFKQNAKYSVSNFDGEKISVSDMGRKNILKALYALKIIIKKIPLLCKAQKNILTPKIKVKYPPPQPLS